MSSVFVLFRTLLSVDVADYRSHCRNHFGDRHRRVRLSIAKGKLQSCSITSLEIQRIFLRNDYSIYRIHIDKSAAVFLKFESSN